MHRCRLTLILLVACCASANVAGAEEPALWTQKPVRVDRSKQNFVRLPALQQNVDRRIWIAVPYRIEVTDSARFSFDGKAFRIGKIIPVNGKRTCLNDQGGRWTCGRAATAMLGYLVRGRKLLCNVAADPREVVLSDCVAGPVDITGELIASGLARSDQDPDLRSREALARRQKVGLWQNPACHSDFEHC